MANTNKKNIKPGLEMESDGDLSCCFGWSGYIIPVREGDLEQQLSMVRGGFLGAVEQHKPGVGNVLHIFDSQQGSWCGWNRVSRRC